MHLAYALYIFNIVIMFEILKNICLKRLRVWELVVDNYSKLNIMASDRNRGIGNEHYLEFWSGIHYVVHESLFELHDFGIHHGINVHKLLPE